MGLSVFNAGAAMNSRCYLLASGKHPSSRTAQIMTEDGPVTRDPKSGRVYTGGFYGVSGNGQSVRKRGVGGT